MDRMMARMRGGSRESGHYDATPGFDANLTVERDGDELVVIADLPGFDREDIHLRYDDGVLLLDATTAASHEGEGTVSTRSRRVSEQIRVGDAVAEDISASYHNGVLEVRLPAAGDEATGHRIDID